MASPAPNNLHSGPLAPDPLLPPEEATAAAAAADQRLEEQTTLPAPELNMTDAELSWRMSRPARPHTDPGIETAKTIAALAIKIGDGNIILQPTDALQFEAELSDGTFGMVRIPHRTAGKLSLVTAFSRRLELVDDSSNSSAAAGSSSSAAAAGSSSSSISPSNKPRGPKHPTYQHYLRKRVALKDLSKQNGTGKAFIRFERAGIPGQSLCRPLLFTVARYCPYADPYRSHLFACSPQLRTCLPLITHLLLLLLFIAARYCSLRLTFCCRSLLLAIAPMQILAARTCLPAARSFSPAYL
jgi:hypothetical protein